MAEVTISRCELTGSAARAAAISLAAGVGVRAKRASSAAAAAPITAPWSRWGKAHKRAGAEMGARPLRSRPAPLPGDRLVVVMSSGDSADVVGGSGGGGGGGSGGSGGGGGGARERSSASSGSGSGSGGASIVCFDLNPQRLPRIRTRDGALVMYGDGANAELVRSTGVSSPRAIIVTYQEPARCLAATSRLRAAFPEAPIYTRASSTREQQALLAGGASVTILETRELACQLGACLFLDEASFSLRDLPLGSRAGDDEKLSVWETAVRALRAVATSNAPLNATGVGEDK